MILDAFTYRMPHPFVNEVDTRQAEATKHEDARLVPRATVGKVTRLWALSGALGNRRAAKVPTMLAPRHQGWRSSPRLIVISKPEGAGFTKWFAMLGKVSQG